MEKIKIGGGILHSTVYRAEMRFLQSYLCRWDLQKCTQLLKRDVVVQFASREKVVFNNRSIQDTRT